MELSSNIAFEHTLSKIYWTRFLEFGATPEGSFWLSKSRQDRRFKIILQEINKISKGSLMELADVGCGYGAFAQYIKTHNPKIKIRYTGYDISPDLIAECNSKISEPWTDFKLGNQPNSTTMFTVMSGTHNLAVTTNLNLWEKHVYNSLLKCWNKTSKAMIFNLQIASKSWISKNKIYYAEMMKTLDMCVSNFGPTKVITHEDLPTDATFLVKKLQ